MPKGYVIQPGDILNIPSVHGELVEGIGPEYNSEETAQEAEVAFQEVLPTAQEYQMEATYYTLECGNGDGFTATMTRPAVGRTVAVDPKIIPLGSELWIDGEGPFIAEDVGGAVKGYRIDIYTGSGPEARERALESGRHLVRVRVFEQ